MYPRTIIHALKPAKARLPDAIRMYLKAPSSVLLALPSLAKEYPLKRAIAPAKRKARKAYPPAMRTATPRSE